VKALPNRLMNTWVINPKSMGTSGRSAGLSNETRRRRAEAPSSSSAALTSSKRSCGFGFHGRHACFQPRHTQQIIYQAMQPSRLQVGGFQQLALVSRT
jgi:hypothetical protein